MFNGRVIACCLLVGLVAAPASAQQRLPAKQRTLILFKSLTYDSNLTRGRDVIRVGVVARKGNLDSEKVGKEMNGQIRSVQNMKVSGLKISAEFLNAEMVDGNWRKLVEDKKVNIFYLSPGLDKLLDGLCDLAQKKKILVVSGEEGYAKKCSSLTFILRDGRPKILINPKAAGTQGSAFREEFLKTAETVR